MGVSSVSLGISGGEDSVDEDEGTNNLSTQSRTFVVTTLYEVGPSSVPVVVRFLEALGQSGTADSAGTLSYHVQERPYQRHLPPHEQPKCYRWVYVPSCM